jgi:hypothetical protein
LRLLPDVDPYVVHLVRDPRAVAYSWQREKRDPGKIGRDGDAMPTRSALLSTRVWIELNGMAELVRRKFGPARSRFVRYEDFVVRPRQTIGEILDMLAVEADPPVDDHGIAHLLPNHTVGGNPNRFGCGPVEIRADDEWKTKLGPAASWTCSALTAPLNAVYRYPLHPAPGRAVRDIRGRPAGAPR